MVNENIKTRGGNFTVNSYAAMLIAKVFSHLLKLINIQGDYCGSYRDHCSGFYSRGETGSILNTTRKSANYRQGAG